MEANNTIAISFTMIKISFNFYNDLIMKVFDTTKNLSINLQTYISDFPQSFFDY